MNEMLSVLDVNRLGDSVKPSAGRLGAQLGQRAVAMFIDRLTRCIGSTEKDKYSYVWRSAIEDHEQDAHEHSARGVFVDMLRDAALAAVSKSDQDAVVTIKLLLGSEFVTVVRVGIYVCSERYGIAGPIFWECFKPYWLTEVEYWHEMYSLVKNGFTRFSAADRSKFLSAVKDLRGNWNKPEKQAEWDDEHRRDILHAAAGLGDADVEPWYADLVKRLGPARDHADFQTYMVSGASFDRSPITTDALLALSNDELLAYLRDFTPETPHWEGPTFRGLAAQIAAAVRVSEDGFASRMPLFADLPRGCQQGLFSGLRERWAQEKKPIDWEASISLIEKVVTSPTFKKEVAAPVTDGFEPNVHWVISDIGMLIKSVTQGTHNLSKGQYSRALKTLDHVLSLAPPTAASEPADALSHALNSSRGRILEAFIVASMALRRLVPEPEYTWDLVKARLDAELATSEAGQNADFAALGGTYCATLHYLSPEWMEFNFDRLFSKQNGDAWKCAIQGFAYQTQVYSWLYKKLTDGGHLRRMVLGNDIPHQSHEKAVQFVAVAYLNGDEPLTGDGLLAELINDLKGQALSELCWYFWTLRGTDGSASHHAPKILDFWMRVAAVILESGNAHAELQSDLNFLTPYIGRLEPAITQAWANAALHAEVKHHGHILLENLSRHVKDSPNEVATIFDAVVTGQLPVFQEKDLIAIIKGLAEANLVEKAESYCHRYGELTPPMLKSVYEELRNAARLMNAP